MLRFRNLAELRKNISPDVEIIDDWQPTDLSKQIAALERKAQRTFLEDTFLKAWTDLGGPALVREYRFHSTRKWRFDFAIPSRMIAFEIMGGLYNPNSGHRSKEGVSRDYEKSNAAQALGWKVYSVTSQDLQDEATMRRLVALAYQNKQSSEG